MRQIVLDTETTGLEPSAGHKIIEIGCVELVNRKLTGRHYHQYIKPNRDIDEGAIEVHGITNEFLADKPVFDAIVEDFLDFVTGAELVIHNAPFDVGFIDHELKQLKAGHGKISDRCSILDSLVLARHKHPGQKNNLDALCKRYDIDNSQRDLHGALLDAEILADVYLAMTGGQTKLSLDADSDGDESGDSFSGVGSTRRISGRAKGLVIGATAEELSAHQAKLESIKSASGSCYWLDD
jgi:DNA polymerase-3 subunit epsilon